MATTLIKNGTVVTATETMSADVLIDGTKVVAIVTSILVVVGGIVAFTHSVGGVVPLLGAGFFFLWLGLVEAAVLSYGIGFFAAILGSVVIILAAAIPKEKGIP